MIQLKRWFITLVLLFSVVAVLGFVKFTQIKAAIAFGESIPGPSATVEVINASTELWQPKLEVVGEVRATRAVELRNEFEGIITKVAYASGGSVKQGDLLVQLDVAPELAQLDAINAEIELAKLDVKRFADLLEVRASSRDQYDRAISQLAVNEALARALQANIDRKTIRAPFSGTVSIHDWEVGTYIPANSVITNLVGDLSSVWVDFSVPQWYDNIALNSAVEVTEAKVNGRSTTATIKAINQQVNQASRSLLMRASFDNTGLGLKPGAMVKVFIPVDDAQPVFPIPNEGLRFDAFGAYVYTLELDEQGDYRAKRRPVTVSTREQDRAMVATGLSTGDVVATVGSAKLMEDMLTYIAQEK
ncbi:efflux RND transporter periplasmic adaptor subunit [Glaciecola sp. XM2]|jgi:membrane fusion protein (multidrug efflux system)|uniref:efflux RND transporter periplasmic adaptor subunit n=1 Tax=Glaciecola sp. XM2 TaxID=1914931 RepID=UPI001BDE2E6C|nr:efflux RND transporter periplasmic adaptor subunit [Glaciecola sp. XM2]MBT1451740.1 efflux RND transporter periplasmic adaptor subunit [Glaciecola sp. XM2]